MILHAIVNDLQVARAAINGGATHVQLRLKNLSTADLILQGRPFRDLCASSGVTFVVNDDVDAAIALGADGVHLGRDDDGIERAREAKGPGSFHAGLYDALAALDPATLDVRARVA